MPSVWLEPPVCDSQCSSAVSNCALQTVTLSALEWHPTVLEQCPRSNAKIPSDNPPDLPRYTLSLRKAYRWVGAQFCTRIAKRDRSALRRHPHARAMRKLSSETSATLFPVGRRFACLEWRLGSASQPALCQVTSALPPSTDRIEDGDGHIRRTCRRERSKSGK